jgi:hypothetical protein
MEAIDENDVMSTRRADVWLDGWFLMSEKRVEACSQNGEARPAIGTFPKSSTHLDRSNARNGGASWPGF